MTTDECIRAGDSGQIVVSKASVQDVSKCIADNRVVPGTADDVLKR